ncbi:hypothetical protein EYF80_047137 [Liparis tanakae]|uniref:Uncharacterized protein n=1 Tax=Liparis tanakae TaxID=230148 RepID=A0A4Z2FPG3_9TELE|nr:hypothetical protein EYF80_047137 [Liparis tanakae]
MTSANGAPHPREGGLWALDSWSSPAHRGQNAVAYEAASPRINSTFKTAAVKAAASEASITKTPVASQQLLWTFDLSIVLSAVT